MTLMERLQAEIDPDVNEPLDRLLEDASTRIKQLEKTLWLFREFACRNASQWVMGAGDHHHPMWAMVSEALTGTDVVALDPTGDDWRFIQPLNRSPYPSDAKP